MSSNIKVLQVIPKLGFGGAETGCYDIAHYLPENNCKSFIVTSGGELTKFINKEKVKLIRLPVHSKNPILIFFNSIFLIGIILFFDISIVHARSRAPAWSCLFATKLTGRKFVTTFHGTYNFSGKIKKLYNSIMVRSDLIIAGSNFIFSHIKKNYSQVKGIMKEAIDELESKKSRKDGITGVPSGFIDLDNITSGWQPSDLVIIAGRPSMGKTAFVLSMMRNASIDHEKPIAIFSLEMSSLQIVNRLISSEAELDSDKIRKGNLKDYEWQQLLHKTDQLNNAKIFIDDTPALSILELRAKSRRLKSQHDIQCIIVDYLQLMTGEYGKSSGNREQEIASISRSLKAIAKELNVPVLALSQLSRAVETRGGDKRPVLSDLRESGSIEQDADMVLFIYRADRYDITEDEDGNLTAGVAEILLRKNRNGPTGKVKLKFIERFAKFADMSSLDGNETNKFQSKANSGFDQNKSDPF